MRREFSRGFARLQTDDKSEIVADDAQVSRFKQLLLDEVDLQELTKLAPEDRRARLERVLAHLVSREGVILSTRERSTLIRRVVDEAVGLGVLEPL
ncbi:MAG TPA: CpaF family protein, partial [Microlunatus sp.]|nr:CpaF family protein [Microlunatus sp.]